MHKRHLKSSLIKQKAHLATRLLERGTTFDPCGLFCRHFGAWYSLYRHALVSLIHIIYFLPFSTFSRRNDVLAGREVGKPWSSKVFPVTQIFADYILWFRINRRYLSITWVTMHSRTTPFTHPFFFPISGIVLSSDLPLSLDLLYN